MWERAKAKGAPLRCGRKEMYLPKVPKEAGASGPGGQWGGHWWQRVNINMAPKGRENTSLLQNRIGLEYSAVVLNLLIFKGFCHYLNLCFERFSIHDLLSWHLLKKKIIISRVLSIIAV